MAAAAARASRSIKCGETSDDLAAACGHRAARRGRRRHRRLQPLPRQDDRRLLRRHAAAAGHGLGRPRPSRSPGSPGIEAIGTARAARGVELAVETGGIVQEILFDANDRVEAGQHSRRSTTHRARRPRRRPGRARPQPRPSSTRAESLRQRGVTRSTTSTSPGPPPPRRRPGGRAHRGDGPEGLEAPFGGIIGIPQVDVGAVRRRPAPSTRRCRTSTPCGSTSPSPSSRSALIEIGMPVTVSTEVGDIDAHRRDHRHRAEDRPELPARHRPRRGRQPRRHDQPGPVPAGAGRAAGEDGVIALPQTVLLDTSTATRSSSVRTAEGEGDGQAASRRDRCRAGLRQGRPPLAAGCRDRRGREGRRPGGDRRAEPADRRRARSTSTTPSTRCRRPQSRRLRARAMHFTELFIRRPVLSTVLARLHPAARLPGHLQPAGPRSIPRSRRRW